MTIPEGECGVFEREGALEIKDPGFYKMSAEYRIRENIPLRVRAFGDSTFLTVFNFGTFVLS